MARALVLTLVAVLGGCREVALGDCEIRCTAASGCPDGFGCSAEGYCRPVGAAVACAMIIDARPDSPQPIDAPLQRIGNPVEFPSSASNSPDFLLGFRITVPTDVVVIRFGITGKAVGPSLGAMMALYTDSIGSPGSLVKSTAPFTLAAGPNEIPVTPGALTAGDYWLMAVYSATSSIGAQAGSVSMKYRSLTFASALPTTFGTPTSFTSTQAFNYWIVVQ